MRGPQEEEPGLYLCDVTEAGLRSSFLFLQFSVLQTSRQALSVRELVCKKGRQGVPRSLSFPISHETLWFYPSWGQAHLKERGAQETRRLLGNRRGY